MARLAVPRRRRDRLAEPGHPARRGCRTSASSRSSGAPTPIASARAPQASCRSSGRPATVTAVFAGAFRAWHGAVHLVDAIRRLRERGVANISAVLVGDGPERAARPPRGRGPRRRDLHRAGRARRHARAPRRRRHRRRAVRRDGPRAAGDRLLLVAAQGVRVHGVGPARRGARDRRHAAHRPGRPRGRALRSVRPAGARTAPSSGWQTGTCGAGSGRRHARAPSASSAGPGTARASQDALTRALVARGRGRFDRHESAHCHRLVPARLRRQRLEHVRAGAWPPRPRSRADDCPAAPGTPGRRAGVRRLRRAGDWRVRAGHSVRPELPEERTPLRPSRQRASPGGCRHEGRDPARSARDDDSPGGRRGGTRRCPVDRDGARLLARLLLVGSDPRPVRRHALPRLLRSGDAPLHPPEGGRIVAARAADGALHAGQPGPQAGGARARGPGDCRQLDDCAGSGGEVRRTRSAPPGHRPQSRGCRGHPRLGRDARALASRAVRPLRRQARAEQGNQASAGPPSSAPHSAGPSWSSATGPIGR